MGARIAAHFANAGCDVTLLDISAELAASGLEKAKTGKPPAFYLDSFASRITTGSFDGDLKLLANADWIVEAVAEDLGIKRALINRVVEVRKPDSVVSTNTSGLPVAQIAEHIQDASFHRNWLGVHFFNPPRYMRLVELIATPQTDAETIARVEQFATERLGKTVVRANDTPNFIGNRIGLFAMFNAAKIALEMGLSIEQVDALTGPAIGWPNTGTFRLMDLIGLDVLANMQRNFESRVKDERADVTTPPVLAELVARGWLGDKAGQGFYKKGEPLLALDLKTLAYRPAQQIGAPKGDLGALTSQNEFLGRMLPELWTYAANRIPEIASGPEPIDAAMRAGFNWKQGPFEMSDAAGASSWYPKKERAAALIVKGNASLSLVDLGEGLARIDLHSKMNALGDDAMTFIPEVLAEARFDGYLIATDAAAFSAGANLSEILALIEAKKWDALMHFIARFQRMTQSVKFSAKPVVAAVCGLCLGGGAELAMAAVRRQVHAETQMGLVESMVGLVPGGGGCKELALYASDSGDWLGAFRLLANGTRTGSAYQALDAHLLHSEDGITLNRNLLHGDALKVLRGLVHSYSAPKPRTVPEPPQDVFTEIENELQQRRSSTNSAPHDGTVEQALAAILLARGTQSEDDFLTREREAFVRLCAEPKTAERIAYTLKTGKPLSN